MTLLLIPLLSSCVVALLIWRAPEGFETADGFFYGKPGDYRGSCLPDADSPAASVFVPPHSLTDSPRGPA